MEALKEILKNISPETSKKDSKLLKIFLKENKEILEVYQRKYIKNLIRNIKLYNKSLKYSKRLKDELKIVSNSIYHFGEVISLAKPDYCKLVHSLDTCYEVDIISNTITETIYSNNKNNVKSFVTREEAEDYVNFAKQIKVGTKFKIINTGKWNDGTLKDQTKDFYNITHKKEYCFTPKTEDKIWEIKAVGYYYNNAIVPYIERNAINSDGEECIEWQTPLYLYKNIEFVTL